MENKFGLTLTLPSHGKESHSGAVPKNKKTCAEAYEKASCVSGFRKKWSTLFSTILICPISLHGPLTTLWNMEFQPLVF